LFKLFFTACCVGLNAGATLRGPATLRYGVKPPPSTKVSTISSITGTVRTGGFGAQQQGGASRLRQARSDENSVTGRLRAEGGSKNGTGNMNAAGSPCRNAKDSNPYFPNKLHKQELVAYNKAS